MTRLVFIFELFVTNLLLFELQQKTVRYWADSFLGPSMAYLNTAVVEGRMSFVWIETETLFLTRGGCVSCLCACFGGVPSPLPSDLCTAQLLFQLLCWTESLRQCPLHRCWRTTWTTRSKRRPTCSAQRGSTSLLMISSGQKWGSSSTSLL